MTRRFAAALTVAVLVLAGCGSDSESSSSDGNAPAAGCTVDSARELTQDFITSSKFDVDCVKVKTGTQFFFINNDDTTHTVTSQSDAPEPFDAELPKKGSTFAYSFTKTGEYKVTCKRHQEALTLFVV